MLPWQLACSYIGQDFCLKHEIKVIRKGREMGLGGSWVEGNVIGYYDIKVYFFAGKVTGISPWC